MLVSLKILPLVVSEGSVQLRVSVGECVGTLTCSLEDLSRAMDTGRPITVQMTEPTLPMPKAKRVKRATMKQEEEVASGLGGHRQRGSGAVPWRKGDGLVKGKYRIENKMRFNKSYRVEREELDKIRSECAVGETPLFQVDFANRATCKVEDRWILVPYEHWKEVAGEATNDR